MATAAGKLARVATPAGAATERTKRAAAGIAARARAADEGRVSLAQDIEELREAGLFAAPLPRAAGGEDLGLTADTAVETASVLRILGAANLSVARLYEGHVNALKLIHVFADPQLRRGVAERVSDGQLLGVWGADGAEPVAFDDAGILSGTKIYASGLGLVNEVVVTAFTCGGSPQMLLVPTGDASRMDDSRWQTAGMRATVSGSYRFDGVCIGTDRMIGEPGDYHREPHFQGGVWRYCAAHVGGAEAIAEVMRHSLVEMGRDGEPHQRMRLGEAMIACQSARLWVESAAMRAEAADAGPEATAYSLLAREAVERACIEVMRLTDRSLGARSFFLDHPAERMRRDLAFFVRQANPDGALARAVDIVRGSGIGIGELWQ